MWPTLKASQRVAVVGVFSPQSSVAALTSGWISAKNFLNFLTIIQTGALGTAALVDCSIAQAQDGSGTNAKAITGKAIVELTKAGTDMSNSQCLINLQQSDFDVTNNFCFFQVTLTPSVAASLVSGMVLGIDPAMGFAFSQNLATVLQVVL